MLFCFQTKVELKKKNGPVQIWLADNSSMILPAADWSRPLGDLLVEIAEKLRFSEAAYTYGFKIAHVPTESPKKKSVDVDEEPVAFVCKEDWLDLDESLSEQRLRPNESLSLQKRYVDRSVSQVGDAEPADEHMTFSQARNEILLGRHDDALFLELQVELAAILLLHTVGRHDPKLSVNYVVENRFSVLSPKWRKKPKAEMVSHISTTHMALSSLPWAFDPRGIKQQFLQSAKKVTSYGVNVFHVDMVRYGMIIMEDAMLTVSSVKILARKKSGKGSSSETVDIPMASINRCSASKKMVSFTFTEDAPLLQQMGLSLASSNAPLMCQTINGYKTAFRLSIRRQRTIQRQLARTESRAGVSHTATPRGLAAAVSAGTLSPTSRRQRRSLEALDADDFLSNEIGALQTAALDLDMLITCQKKSKRNFRHRSSSFSHLEAKTTASALFNQAATHLSSISHGVNSISTKLKNGNSFMGAEGAKSEAALSQWCTALVSVASCLREASDKTSTGIQSIAFVAKTFLQLGINFISFVASVRRDPSSEHAQKVELPLVEKCLLAGCSALDLALQDRICEQTAAVTLLTCCSDIHASAYYLLRFAETAVAKAEKAGANASKLRQELRKARTVFSWYRLLFLTLSSILTAEDANVLATFKSGIEAFDSSANSLVSVILDTISDQEKTEADSSLVPQIKQTWSSLGQSLKFLAALVPRSTQPDSQIDPMLPPVLYQVISEASQFLDVIASPSFTSKSVSHVISNASGIVRCLAVLASVEPSPTLILQSSSIESAIEKLRQSFKPPEGETEPSRLLIGQSAMGLLESCLDAVSDSGLQRGMAEALVAGCRSLILSLTLLRSTLLNASFLPPSTALTQVSVTQKFLERMDAIMDEAVPFLASVIAFRTEGGAISPEDVIASITMWLREIRAIGTEMDSDLSSIGIFADVLTSQRKKLQKRLETSQGLLPEILKAIMDDQVANNKTGTMRSMKRTLKRFSSVRRILTRPSTELVPVSSTDPHSPSSGGGDEDDYFRADGADPVREKGSQGAISFINESGLLQVMSQLIAKGSVQDLEGMPLADVIQLSLVTHPYWTVPDSLMGSIISSCAVLLSAGCHSISQLTFYFL